MTKDERDLIFDAYVRDFPNAIPPMIWFNSLPDDEQARIIEEKMLPAIESGKLAQFESTTPERANS